MPVSSASTVVLALLAGVATAMPFAREHLIARDQSITAQDFMSSAINALLAQQNQGGNHFYALEGWNVINFGNGKALVDGADTTSGVAYLSADISQGSNGSARTYFSTSYMNFVQEMSKVMDVNKGEAKDLEDTMNQQAKSCGPDLVKALGGALQTYIGLNGKTVVALSDPDLLQWAQTSYAPYMQAHLECQSATNSYNSAANKYYGDDFSIFSAAENGITPLTVKNPVVTPGISMSVGAGNGSVVPYYSIPVMNSTVAAWVEGNGLTPFHFDSADSKKSTSQSSNSSKSTQNIVWSKKGGSDKSGSTQSKDHGPTKSNHHGQQESKNHQQESKNHQQKPKNNGQKSKRATPTHSSKNSTPTSKTNASASKNNATHTPNKDTTPSKNSTSTSSGSTNSSSASYAHASISFKSAANMEVLRGGWFDDWRAASALQNPSDDIAKKGGPAFQKYFGTAQNPGPAAFYNDKALVVFRPTISIQFSDSSAYSDFKKSQNTTDACVPYLCTSKQTASSQSHTQFHDANQTIVYEDNSNNAYIIGFTVASFWKNS